MMDTWIGAAMPPLFRRPYTLPLLAAAVLSIGRAAGADEDFRYVVRPGDNPWNLTERYLKSIDYWPRIQQYNRIEDPHAIAPGTVLRMPIAWMRGEPGRLRVADVHGSAELLHEGGAVALATGMTLARGALIRTGEASSLLLEFPDGSRSLMGENSEVRVVHARRLTASAAQQVELELRRGRLENHVEKARAGGGRFEIRTPAAVAAVRGTEFRVAASAEGARAETLAGEVALRNRRGEVRLPAGTGTLAATGRTPERASTLLEAPRLDALPPRVERLPFALPFPPVPGAHGYRTQLAPLGTPGALVSERLAGAPAAIGGGELPDGHYTVRVRAIDGRALEGHDAERELEIDARPDPPFPSLPVQDGVAIDDPVEFRWTRSADAAHYHFQLAADAGFGALVVERERLADARVALDAPLPPGTYHWRVARATDAEGRGPFSDVQRFRRLPPGPSAEAGESAGRFELRWKSGGEAARYEVEMSRDPGFATPEIAAQTPEAILSIDTPPPGLYHVRVRTLEPDGTPGPWGAPQQFEITRSYWWLPLLLIPLLLVL